MAAAMTSDSKTAMRGPTCLTVERVRRKMWETPTAPTWMIADTSMCAAISPTALASLAQTTFGVAK